MKILIADDEKISRIMLRSMLSEINLPLQLVGEAADGDDMVKKIKALRPSIVIADIRMPKLNGLEAIKKIKEEITDIQWIILTGFSEFQYAKQSIDLGVSRYLLKPVNPEELQDALAELCAQYRKSCMNQNKDFENDMINMISGLKNSSQYHSEFAKPSFTGWIFHFDSALSTEQRNQKQQKIYEDIRMNIDNLADSTVNIAVLPLSDSEIAVIIVFDLSCQSNIRPLKNLYLSQFMRSIHLSSSDHFMTTCFELPDYDSFFCLEQEMALLKEISSIRVVCKLGKQLTFETAASMAKEKKLLAICKTITEIQACYVKSDYLNFTKLTSELEILLNNNLLLNQEMKVTIVHFLKAAMDCDISSLETFRQWSAKIKQSGETLLTRASSGHDDIGMIHQVKKYIDENYMKEIGITEISDSLNITPNYLSTLFHKETGLTFTKYLTNTRMLKAKELLLNPNNKVKDVANRVGYYNTRYFTKLFKNYYDCYPSESINRSCN